jgi:hypothetical protein
MADFQIPDKDFLSNVDRSADSFLIYDASATALKRTSINSALDLTSHPVGIDDIQTLTNKTISGSDNSITDIDPTEVTGLPSVASIVTLTGSQTLTQKTLTSPTITNAIISNPTLTVDTISEFTSANGVTIDGLNIKDGKLNTNNSVVTSNITDGAVTSDKTSDSSIAGSMSSVSVTTAVQNGASVVLPAVSAPHRYLIIADFVVSHQGAGIVRDYTVSILNGASQLRRSIWTAVSGNYYNTIPVAHVHTSSSSGGETINFSINRNSDNGGVLDPGSSYAIIDLGLA